MQISFAGRSAIVTGAGSGIGAAIAQGLASAGASVLVSDVNADAAQEVAGQIAAAGGTALADVTDVADPVAVEAMVARAATAWGGPHLLVNNAGIGGPLLPLGEYTLEGWRQVMSVNLDGVFYGMRYAIPRMLEAGGGAIVNMASILGSVGFEGASAYVATKHALLGLTRAAALEYAGRGIRINAVGPAFIDTPLLNNLPDEARAQLVSLHPVGRLGASEEVAALTLFLLSEQAAFINGSYHLCDGGYCAR